MPAHIVGERFETVFGPAMDGDFIDIPADLATVQKVAQEDDVPVDVIYAGTALQQGGHIAAGAVIHDHIGAVAAHGAAVGLRDFLKRPQIGDKQPVLITYHVGQRFGGRP